jgi:hypothetical protein
MSLDARYTKIKNYEELCYFTDEKGQPRLNPVTEILVFATLAVGLHEITEENIDEWELRLEMLTLAGETLGILPDENGERKPWQPGREELEEHLGLWTNAFPSIERAEFRAKLAISLERYAARAIEDRWEKRKQVA